MTQSDLAAASGVSRETIGRLERGERQAQLLTLVAVSLALHVSLEALLRGVPAMGVSIASGSPQGSPGCF